MLGHPSCLPIRDMPRKSFQAYVNVHDAHPKSLPAMTKLPPPTTFQNRPYRERIVYFFLSFEALFVLAVPRNSFDLFLRCLRCCLLAFSIFVAMPTRTSL